MPLYLAMLLFVPVMVGIFGLFVSKGKVTIKEFLVMELAVAIILVVGIGISWYSSTGDWEIWNGRVVDKKQVRVSCEHSYSCNPYPCNCDKDGCQTCWQTCYEHSNDWDWNLYTVNGETIEIKRVDRRGSREPPRWTRAYIGEPTALDHRFTNYVKANPDTILRRRGAIEKFKNLIPSYPINIYDYHYVNRFLDIGVGEKFKSEWDKNLQEINADLGPKKQANVIVVAVPTHDHAYQYALEEAWIGGKKNDVIVILGVTEYPKIAWVRVSSWSKAENLKVELRDAILDIGTMKERQKILDAIKTQVDQKFIRRRMRDLQYLAAGLQPGATATIVLFILGLATEIGLLWYFYHEDPFDTGYQRYNVGLRRRF